MKQRKQSIADLVISDWEKIKVAIDNEIERDAAKLAEQETKSVFAARSGGNPYIASLTYGPLPPQARAPLEAYYAEATGRKIAILADLAFKAGIRPGGDDGSLGGIESATQLGATARTDPDIVKRRCIVAQNPSMQAAGLCQLFDHAKVPIPKGFAEVGSWVKAFKSNSYRPRIESLISKDRKKVGGAAAIRLPTEA